MSAALTGQGQRPAASFHAYAQPSTDMIVNPREKSWLGLAAVPVT